MPRNEERDLAPTRRASERPTRRRFGQARLRVERGDEVSELPVDSLRVTGGRSSVNDVVLDDDAVSALHFELRLGESGVGLRDLGSTNGTWVAGARIESAWLEPGASFRVGGARLRLIEATEIDVAISPDSHFGDMQGASPVMRELFAILERLAPTPIDLLITGETGTGKEVAARAVHDAATGRTGPFRVLDCAALPRELAEATVLGHRKGAFTGAVADQAGCFEAAHGGTLFIDEVGELPLDLQPKLLRVLERREVVRIGEHAPRPVDVRVIAATHRDLRQMVGDGSFREDLYYRLADAAIELPPLRDRGDDIALLAEEFRRECARDESIELSAEALTTLRRDRWPGNVRQLRRAVRRAVFLAEGGVVQPSDLGLAKLEPTRAAAAGDELFALPFKEARAEFERRYFRQLMDQQGGSLADVARKAGYTRAGLRELLRRLDFDPGRG